MEFLKKKHRTHCLIRLHGFDVLSFQRFFFAFDVLFLSRNVKKETFLSVCQLQRRNGENRNTNRGHFDAV